MYHHFMNNLLISILYFIPYFKFYVEYSNLNRLCKIKKSTKLLKLADFGIRVRKRTSEKPDFLNYI